MIYIEYAKVQNKLYYGSYPQEQDDFKFIKTNLGLNIILNLQHKQDFAFGGLIPEVAHRMALNEYLSWTNIPIKDFNASDLMKKIPQVVAFLKHNISSGVYVHCTKGLNRSATAVAAYLILFESFNATNAISKIRENRPEAIFYESVLEKIAKNKMKISKKIEELNS